jgi:hypothetical protein
MFVKLMGILDLLAAIFMILLKWNIGSNIALVIAVLLGIKSIIFFYNWASVVDLITVGFLILAVFGYYFFFSWIFSLWLLQKAFFSLFG